MPREWNILVYLGGDNNLEARCLDDLRELKAVGSSETVAVAAQIDRMSDAVTRRYLLSTDTALADDVAQELAEVNTGDPAALVDFVRWAAGACPARRTALVLGSHGDGWKDVDIYRAAVSVGIPAEEALAATSRGQEDSDPPLPRALFLSSIRQILTSPAEERAIMYDNTARDFLDTLELHRALCQLAGELGKPFDLVGFDACLMSSLEIAFQLQDVCQVLVGSQNNEPGSGWPYEQILGGLVASPGSGPEHLGESIVAAFTNHYLSSPARDFVTLSAVRCTGVAALAAAVDVLADRLIDELASNDSFLVALMSIQRHVTRFSDRDQVDLLHLARLLAERSEAPATQAAAAAVEGLILSGAETSVVVAARQAPPNRAAGATQNSPTVVAGGLSLYWPRTRVSPAYERLELARQGRWNQFLHTYYAA